MTTAGEIISRASVTLFDEAGVRWNQAELLTHLNDAQKDVVLLKPSAYTKNETVQLIPGSFQSLPAEGLILVDVVANMGLDGSTPGKSVSQIDRETLQACRPNWRAEGENASVRHYMFDDRDPSNYEIYPAQPATAGYVRIVYGATPPVITGTGSQVALPEIYDTALYYLVLSRCYAKSTSTQDFNKSLSYQQLATSLITGRSATKQQLHPEQTPKRVNR
jgi:hypothetical protein